MSKAPTDQQLIDAARQAGLCYPDCWNLEHTTEDTAANARFVQDGYDQDPAIGKTRQQVLDASEQQRAERLQRLRHFAELITTLQP